MSSYSSDGYSVLSTHPQQNQGSYSRLFHVNKSSFQRHYEIASANNQTLLYGDVSVYTPHKPDLTLHAGTNTHAPIVAVSRFGKLTSTLKIGLGDPNNVQGVEWEDLKRQNLRATEYGWQMTLRYSDGSRERRAFTWKRTHHAAVDGMTASSLSPRNYKLVDPLTGQLLAVFTSDRSLHKCGDLQINVNYGPDFDTMVFITYLSIHEKVRRRNESAAAAAS
ncbi:hypothetical protein ASPZODRAFT_11628 [Penicilliopsis zonata CBS 506.65]|uniref:Uncharacterized protein n=1 Tax=Penicilliopsis zonata CBS 506.65 TaxID=1073090 RepID=A0A1L9SUI3_9EURO|nr:hypothetical protein ASPZODRAFT_11628 [Penicilliopsis zonata CBS 506.65]OJJ50774.1 hypothetical protein ASPZODRAFT_11628 [Penicilliopsis zonata CBS 506.65]